MFSIFKEQEKVVDSFEKMGCVLKLWLTFEIKELPLRYEFWYRIATRLEELRTLQAEHRENSSMNSAVGRFHQVQYEETKQKYARLERISDLYKLFCIESERDILNHRLRLHQEEISVLYAHVQKKNLLTYCNNVQQQFWDAVCVDILQAIAHLD